MMTQLQLDAYVGKSMSEICPNGFVRDADSQGAHFVGHALRLHVPPTCQMLAGGVQPGVSVAASAIFTRCAAVGAWSLRPATLTACLVFSTPLSAVHLTTKLLRVMPRQQIGIFLNGFVWHFSPREARVVRETAASFAQHQAPGFAMFYGTLP